MVITSLHRIEARVEIKYVVHNRVVTSTIHMGQ